ncbi:MULTISPECIES: hypothetical protein [Enterobacteriaceae]|uniref:hypothetical protein n=1 Tax=Enterobacteriaceae TaxID=543 RepID=UPI00032F4FC3|nr:MULTISPECIES: hypothetical protein [Enterobacteriaceae]EOQ51074.1 hypothetical protein WC7_00037 [Citrobacter sp. KTE151]MEB6621574.1 hypothetical protein [Enterobacter roggenkampii]MEB6647303.1 hypothetical protein [Enterobacter kobei]
MYTETVKPLNYTVEAIKDLKIMERGIRENAPYTAYVMRQVIDLLHESPKFILPNCCDIIEPDEYRQAHLDLARLPYPVVVFEIPWVKDEPDKDVPGFSTLPSTKRIALCWESRAGFEPVPGCNQILKSFTDGGVFILPISWSDSISQWILGIGGVFFPHENTLRKRVADEEQLPASKIALEVLRDSGSLTPGSAQFKAEPFVACPEFKDEMSAQAGSLDRLYAQILIDTRDELQAFIQACSVLNCENVKPVTLSAKPQKKFVNGRRVKPMEKKDLPAYTYKVLQLSDEKVAAQSSGEGTKGGSKRMHLRRGHIRRRNDKLHWVRPSMVNANSSAGMVDKDYAIRIKSRDDE